MDVKVGISDFKSVSPPDTVVTIGLGSCIGIALYDKISKIAGLAHIMLPLSTNFSDTSNLKKFADTCIPLLLKEMEQKGASRYNITAKIAGGSNMFKMSGETIGDKNIQAVVMVLGKLNIPIKAKDVGGSVGRTLRIDAATGDVYIKKVGTAENLL